jgi:hypothetical protein
MWQGLRSTSVRVGILLVTFFGVPMCARSAAAGLPVWPNARVSAVRGFVAGACTRSRSAEVTSELRLLTAGDFQQFAHVCKCGIATIKTLEDDARRSTGVSRAAHAERWIFMKLEHPLSNPVRVPRERSSKIYSFVVHFRPSYKKPSTVLWFGLRRPWLSGAFGKGTTFEAWILNGDPFDLSCGEC